MGDDLGGSMKRKVTRIGKPRGAYKLRHSEKKVGETTSLASSHTTNLVHVSECLASSTYAIGTPANTKLPEESDSVEFGCSDISLEDGTEDEADLFVQSEICVETLCEEETVIEIEDLQDDVVGEKQYVSGHTSARLFPAMSVKEKETLMNFFEPIESESEDLFDSLLNSSDFDVQYEENLLSDSEYDDDNIDGEEANDKQFEFAETVDPPLYQNSATTLGFTVLMIITYAMRHHLTGLALTHLLLLICFLLPDGHKLMRTLKEFKKYFLSLKTPVIYHGFCIKCYTVVPKQQQNTCDNPLCLADLSKASSKGYFLEIPIISQLSSMFFRKGFYNDIQHRFSRTKTNKESIGDIYDGNLYKHLFNSGQLSNPNNISFICNTDGVPLFKSSNFSLWPLYLAINELPLKKRFLKENMILAGLWYGKTKPSMWSFLKPFYESLRDLEEVGVKFYSPDCGEFICKSFLICGTLDLPARALVCNSTQFNGHFGCWKCLQPGGTVLTEKGGASSCISVLGL